VRASEAGLLTDETLCAGLGRCADACPSGAREMCGKSVGVDEVTHQILKERLFFEQSGGGVTLTGGEPLSQPEFAIAILRECKKYELHTTLDTSGFASPSVIMETIPHTDLFLYDIKIMNPDRHREFTGVDNEIILSNLSKLASAGAEIWARMPFIPGINTDLENLNAAGKFISGLNAVRQLNILPYHSAAEDKHNRWGIKFGLKGLRPPTEQSLRSAAKIIESFGVKVLIGG
jgi:pyruvate formate lyase activating enzyme